MQFADVILLNKATDVSKAVLGDIKRMIEDLNPHASLITSSYGRVPISRVVDTRLYSLQRAQEHEEWCGLYILHSHTYSNTYRQIQTNTDTYRHMQTQTDTDT